MPAPAALIIQMVVWLRRHGRTLKRELESALEAAAAQARWWSIFVLAMIAVTREGSETVILPDSGPIGGLVGALTGYRARPHLIEVLVYLVYWTAITALLYRPAPRTKTA